MGRVLDGWRPVRSTGKGGSVSCVCGLAVTRWVKDPCWVIDLQQAVRSAHLSQACDRYEISEALLILQLRGS